MSAKLEYTVRPFGILGGKYAVDKLGRNLHIANWTVALLSALALAVAVPSAPIPGIAGLTVCVLLLVIAFVVCARLSVVIMQRGRHLKS